MRSVPRWLTILALVSCALAGAQEPDREARAFLKAWASRMKEVKSLAITFEQTKQLKILRRPLVSRGRVLLKGKKLLMVVESATGERETELHVDVERGEVRLHYPRLRRLEVFDMGKGGPPSTPFPFFGGDVETLPDTHHVRLERDAATSEPTLVLVPRDAASVTGESRLGFGPDHLVKRVRQVGKKGDVLTIEISKFELNPEVSDDDVALRVPEGTTVTRPLAGK